MHLKIVPYGTFLCVSTYLSLHTKVLSEDGRCVHGRAEGARAGPAHSHSSCCGFKYSSLFLVVVDT